ncbi:hypothetical protein SAMN02745824_1193 [Parasphingorhabdus marina DSM 22363]|uniref:Uncharacterized protein n=1 Tax=Parasphingorhabdus marina DSM 22363 TaxID=1123272 RepID=A0A1N6CXB2_9SPHN|nr:hypothetical protein [Parasphingorhabdus marina]SIN63180.1 hypothetical protein SAMN02745824_1193 [Parasphingorhabdus marina DSM 22363]
MILSLALLAMASENTITPITMGDGQIDGRKITAYDHSWRQCNLQDGQWVAGPALRERATVIGDKLLRIDQHATLPGNVINNMHFYFDRATLAPVRLEREFLGPDGRMLASRTFDFDEQGYRAEIFQKGETTVKTGALTASMYSAATMGLPLSTLEFGDQTVAFTALMTNFDASYAIQASKTGAEMLETETGQIPVDWIDVTWKHNEAGDIYPPGPDASGGRYWITRTPVEGVPRILRYKTDSYVVEFEPQYCPAPAKDTMSE